MKYIFIMLCILEFAFCMAMTYNPDKTMKLLNGVVIKPTVLENGSIPNHGGRHGPKIH